ncbi:type IV secretion system protein [Proteus mirabilis]|uniref:type IV secretion system protein n=1 Tax=Proteus mirabilis TaxID=584 RepID=UPI001BB06100|nr:type IV secretion system protein [Proteus mirabilis]MBS3832932.1 type IV secretion system protein [Proteus mirabilis]MCT0075388.1 type IV secretion system protein [Proteus mirabilis]
MATTQDAVDSYWGTGLNGGSANLVVPSKPPLEGQPAQYDSNFFQTAHEIITDILKSSTQGKMGEFIDIAYSLGKFGVQAYILWYIFTILAGKQQKTVPVQDFIWNVLRFTFILMIVRNVDGWLDTSVSSIYGLKNLFAGGDVYLWLDQLWVKTVQTAEKIFDLDNSKYVPASGTLGALFTYLGGLIALMCAALTFFAAEVTLMLLTITAPLFIMCLMFGFLRQMFNNWLQMIFSALLVFLFGGLALRAGTWYLNTILTTNIATASNQNLIYMGASALAGGIFMAFVIWQAKTYASQIAGVGAEGALQGAAAMGLTAGGFGMGRMVSGGLRMGKNAGVGAGRGLVGQSGGFGKSEGFSGKAGNVTGQATRRIGKEVAAIYKKRFEQ